ncbi:hypothetical protein OPT61_g482 [Boeremia exigua]|uniref:Uncharacterized protein n=1 Tax=Boeremia exigua TaxID=749465 RepID=A0ACC2ITT9_9PLEO|nr:hypothetical protein OPT61_g482 [Boeremia exigua]
MRAPKKARAQDCSSEVSLAGHLGRAEHAGHAVHELCWLHLSGLYFQSSGVSCNDSACEPRGSLRGKAYGSSIDTLGEIWQDMGVEEERKRPVSSLQE